MVVGNTDDVEKSNLGQSWISSCRLLQFLSCFLYLFVPFTLLVYGIVSISCP